MVGGSEGEPLEPPAKPLQSLSSVSQTTLAFNLPHNQKRRKQHATCNSNICS